MSLRRDEARMGQFIKYHRREPLNVNALIHALVSPAQPLKLAHGAAITRGKEFPDVSFYQGTMDWSKFRLKSDAVVIRAGQNLWVDSQFARNWAEARARGILRGSYWFYDGRIDPGRQAQLWIDQMKADPPEMECWMDWERSYGGAFEGLANVVACMQKVESAGFKVGLYTGYYWFTNQSNPITHANQYKYLATKPLWLAWYTADSSIVLIPKPWTNLTLWQYGTPAVGAEYGAQTVELDMNTFNGSSADFYARYAQSEQPPTGGTMTQYQVIGTQGLNLRSGPSTTSTVLKLAPTGSMLWGVKDATTGWIVGTKYQEPGKAEVMLNFYCSSLATLVSEYVPPAAASVFVSHTFNDTLTINGVTYTATFSVPNVEYKPQP